VSKFTKLATVNDFIHALTKLSEVEKNIPLKFCGEWEDFITSVEFSHFDGSLLMIIN
jgi:hypothetical protein